MENGTVSLFSDNLQVNVPSLMEPYLSEEIRDELHSLRMNKERDLPKLELDQFPLKLQLTVALQSFSSKVFDQMIHRCFK